MPYEGDVFLGVTEYDHLTTEGAPKCEESSHEIGATGLRMCVDDTLVAQIRQAQADGTVTRMLEFTRRSDGKNEMRLKWPKEIELPGLSEDGKSFGENVTIQFEKNFNLMNRGMALIYKNTCAQGGKATFSAIQAATKNLKNYSDLRTMSEKTEEQKQKEQKCFDDYCSALDIGDENKAEFKTFIDNCCIENGGSLLGRKAILPKTKFISTWDNFAIKLEKNEALSEMLRKHSPSISLSEKIYSDTTSMLGQMDRLCRIGRDGQSDTTFTMTECQLSADMFTRLSSVYDKKSATSGEEKMTSTVDISFGEQPGKRQLLKTHRIGVLGTLPDGRVLTTEAFAPNQDTLFDSPGATSRIHFGIYKDKKAIIRNYQGEKIEKEASVRGDAKEYPAKYKSLFDPKKELDMVAMASIKELSTGDSPDTERIFRDKLKEIVDKTYAPEKMSLKDFFVARSPERYSEPKHPKRELPPRERSGVEITGKK